MKLWRNKVNDGGDRECEKGDSGEGDGRKKDFMNESIFQLSFQTFGLSDRLGLDSKQEVIDCFQQLTCCGESTVALGHRAKRRPGTATGTEHQLRFLLTDKIQRYRSALRRLLRKHRRL